MQYTLPGNTGLTVSRPDLKAVAVTLTAAEIADLETATTLAPVYPNFFTDNIAPDRALLAALGGR